MISMFLIKTALLRFGVVVQDVKFDVDGECVIVNYMMHGSKHRKAVPFSEVEQLFTSAPEASADSDPLNVVGRGYRGPDQQ